MYRLTKKIVCLLLVGILAFNLAGCSINTGGKRIIRISHGQSSTHPQHIGLLTFKEHIESQLGDKYDIQIFPNELLGPSNKAIELVQTGAIDFVVSSTGNLETFDDIYQIFSMPYLFDSVDAYHKVMEDKELMESIFKSTEAAGFEAITWFDAGTRNFYATSAIRTPEDLKGKKIRVQQSPTNVRMMELFGAAAAPMSFGEVYTAIQSGVIDGGENNELALTNNKHGEVAKYYSYNHHQMVPDMLIGNVKFLNELSPEERKIFNEAAELCTITEREYWDIQIQEAIDEAKSMGVEFIETDIELFKEKVLPLHEELLEQNSKLIYIYEKVQEINKEVKGLE
ncbi:TRAP transporter substrate-binding protein [Tissierella sp. MSJ-40]|uniref:TRAP transporter substrate-binding protein n=1 Tax=Tissierella simiarum TaxID=2841534 RepID=A0ABS6E1Y1_9FIRM|nr:TRAP transporter substrate-binding protein [Tissierella simiarum]MBU5436804.1 TRAP transporter substrate-binding protein [Tissierella simiarum]